MLSHRQKAVEIMHSGIEKQRNNREETKKTTLAKSYLTTLICNIAQKCVTLRGNKARLKLCVTLLLWKNSFSPTLTC